MTGYFSNHSQSRFLSNATSAPARPAESPAAAPASRPRMLSSASSRHFSTSLNNSNMKSKSRENLSTKISNEPSVHPLRHTWVFWFRQQRSPGNKIISYEEGIKRISAFSSVESFMTLYTHLTPPSQLQPTTDYLLFHSQIQRPVWEDPLNITGGKWIIRLKKGVADRLWEDLCLAVVGDQFNDCDVGNSGGGSTGNWEEASDGDQFPEICGCTISVRAHEDIITLWNRVESGVGVRDKIREALRRVLNLPPSTTMEYKTNNDSMQDKSSFRTTPVTTPMS